MHRLNLLNKNKHQQSGLIILDRKKEITYCQLCKQNYDLDMYKAECAIPCGHTFCKQCAANFLKKPCCVCKMFVNQIIPDYAMMDIIADLRKVAINQPNINNNININTNSTKSQVKTEPPQIQPEAQIEKESIEHLEKHLKPSIELPELKDEQKKEQNKFESSDSKSFKVCFRYFDKVFYLKQKFYLNFF